MTKWYYVEDGERVGPVEEEGLQELVDDGVLKEDSYVWTKGFDNWQRLHSVSELEYLFSDEEEELPPTNEMPPIISEESEVKEFSWESLSHDDKVISIKVGIDRGEEEVEYGPYTLNQLKQAFDEYRINEKTLVYIPGMKEWIFLGDAPIYESVFGEIPPQINDIDRRMNIRKPFIARMFFHDSKDVFEGICRDISVGGMQVLVSGAPVKEGEEITLNVHPDNDSYNFVATGLVVRVLEKDQGFALRFVDLTNEAETAINSYVSEH